MIKSIIATLLITLCLTGYAQADVTGPIGGSLNCTSDDGVTCTSARSLDIPSGKTLTVQTQSAGDNSTKAASTAYVDAKKWRIDKTILAPTSSDTYVKTKFSAVSTVTSCTVECTGGTSIVFDLQRCAVNGVACETILDSTLTVTCGTDGAADLIATPTVTAAKPWLNPRITTVTGAVTDVNISIEGTTP